jgi:hypothetical protein
MVPMECDEEESSRLQLIAGMTDAVASTVAAESVIKKQMIFQED